MHVFAITAAQGCAEDAHGQKRVAGGGIRPPRRRVVPLAVHCGSRARASRTCGAGPSARSRPAGLLRNSGRECLTAGPGSGTVRTLRLPVSGKGNWRRRTDWAVRMKRSMCILVAVVCVGCESTQERNWPNYSRELQTGETVLIGSIERLGESCKAGEKIASYTIRAPDGGQYPLIFEPIAPTKVFPGQYDVTGHLVSTADRRFDQAFSVRPWSRVK